MMQAELQGFNNKTIVTAIRCFDPMWMNKIGETLFRAAVPALVAGHEETLKDQAGRLAEHVSDTYCRPNFGKSARILTCTVSDEGGGNQLVFSIPVSKKEYMSIKVKQDLSLTVRWPSPAHRELAGLMARLVLANDLRGKVILDGVYEVSFRAALIAGLMGEGLCGPFIDMAQDGLIEDYTCVSSTQPRASGVKSKKEEMFLEL